MQKTESIEREVHVWLPRQIAKKEIREAVSFGLFNIAAGKAPAVIPEGEKVTSRIKLNASAQKYLPYGVKRYGDEKAAIVHALAWLAEQHEYVLLTRI